MGRTMNFESLQLAPELLRALADCGYTEPTPIQAQTIPPLLAGPRRHRVGADRHRQDRGLRAAGAAALCRAADGAAPGASVRSASVPARSGARADARTRAAGRRAGGALRRAFARQDRVHLRRRAVPGAEPRARARRRHPGRHAGPADRSRRARPHRPVAARDAGARRGRPHARHGLHRGRRAHLPRARRRRARRCCSRRRSTARSAGSPRKLLRDPVRIDVDGRQGRADRDRAARAFHRRSRAQAPHARPSAGRHRR